MKKSSLRRRLLLFMLAMNLFVLLISLISVYMVHVREAKKDLIKMLNIFSDMTAASCIPTILFPDPETAKEEIDRLREIPTIESAYLYTRDKTVFASFGEEPDARFINFDPQTELTEWGSSFVIRQPLVFKNEMCGLLVISMSNAELVQKSRQTLSTFILAMAILFLCSGFMALLIQGAIMKPIEGIAGLAEKVTALDRYDLRFPKSGLLEFDFLTNAMNRMLGQIEARQQQRDLAENALRESEERFRSTFEQASVGLAHLNTEGEFIWVNKKMADIFGTQPSNLYGKPFWSFSGDPDFWQAAIHDIVKGEKTEISVEKTFQRWTGDLFWGQHSLAPVTDGESTNYLVSVLEDTTRNRQLEEELHHSRRMDSLGRLAGGVAHDFNNILTVIRGYCDLFQATKGELFEEIRPILDATDRAMKLTQQLLAFGRKQLLQTQIFQVNTMLNDLKSMLFRLIREDIHLEIHLDPSAGNINSEKSQLEQVIVNLVVNARDAMPQGGVLTLRTVSGKRWPQDQTPQSMLQQPHSFVVIEVIDSGVGMDEMTKERIFEPFFTTKEKGKGTGLGLASAHGIVLQFGGSIRVQSTVGKGSRFQIFLPCCGLEVDEEVASEPITKNVGAGQTILLVEDQSELREMLSQTLQLAGFKTLSAAHGKEALGLLDSYKIDLIISDIVMPVMNGYELYQHLKNVPEPPPVLFISGYPDDENFLRLVREGNLPYLGKPFSSKMLLEMISNIFSQQRKTIKS
ncbi:MAG: response regulator [Acidobacteria bacterium]|nr:response regulator [Acidobacteriota bacterium]